MRFSERTKWNTEESELARAYRIRRDSGKTIADLTVSNPTTCGFRYPTHLLHALTDNSALTYDPQPRGSLAARRAVCAYYSTHEAQLDPDQIVLTTSTSEAYSFLFRLLCDPGGEVLTVQPGYPLFDFLADLDDVRLRPVPLVYHQGWQIDPEGLRRAVTPATRAMVIVHPNNPTGHFTKPWEVEQVAQICREFDLSLIVDEVFLDYSFGDSAKTLADGLEDVPVFVVSGLSKIAGLPQMKAAWIAVTGPEHREALNRLEVIADTFLSMNAPVQSALPIWLEARQHIQLQILGRVEANLAELDRQICAVPALSRLNVEGGWYAVLRVPAIQPDEQTALELLEQGVWVQPGYFFGFPGSGWLVVSLLTPESIFRTGVMCFINYFSTNQSSTNFSNAHQEKL